jgi:hypothetical protein
VIPGLGCGPCRGVAAGARALATSTGLMMHCGCLRRQRGSILKNKVAAEIDGSRALGARFEDRRERRTMLDRAMMKFRGSRSRMFCISQGPRVTG